MKLMNGTMLALMRFLYGPEILFLFSLSFKSLFIILYKCSPRVFLRFFLNNASNQILPWFEPIEVIYPSKREFVSSVYNVTCNLLEHTVKLKGNHCILNLNQGMKSGTIYHEIELCNKGKYLNRNKIVGWKQKQFSLNLNDKINRMKSILKLNRKIKAKTIHTYAV